MTTRIHKAAWPTLNQLWALATITLLALRVQLTPIAPNDFWWHIATGRAIVQTGGVPLVDRFSYTQYGQPYFNQPWLAQTFMYGVYQIGGAELLELLQGVLIAVSFGIMYHICRREGVGTRAATIATLSGALIAMGNWQIRPQTYALLPCIAAISILLEWRRSGKARLWALPLLMLVWVNLHGTFTLLLVMCGLVWLGAAIERVWRQTGRSWREIGVLAAWGVVTLVATVANPRGFGIWQYVAGLLTNQSVSQLVSEWASPFHDYRSTNTMLFFVLLALFVGLCAWRWRRIALADMLLVLPFLLLALQSVRNILWFGVVATPLAARLLASHAQQSRSKTTEIVLINRLIAGLLIALLVATLPWWKQDIGLPPALGDLLSAETPIAATVELKNLPQRPQRMFHDMSFGSYLIWEVPEQRVFVDPRIELYPYEQWIDYIELGQGKNVDAMVEKYDFDGWLLDPQAQAELVSVLERNNRWQRMFTTEEAVYFGPRLIAHQSP
jgi:hypothetical protein